MIEDFVSKLNLHDSRHPMKFWQRVANTLLVEAQKRLRDYFVFPRLEEIINKKFPGREYRFF